MRGWLIDTRGEVWPDASSALRASYWSRLPAVEFQQFAVKSLGFIHVVETPRALHVHWRPTFVTDLAFAGLAVFVMERADSRVMVSTLGLDWTHRLCASVAVAKEHLVDVFRTAVCEAEGHFRARRRRIDQLPAGHRLARLTSEMSRAGQPLDGVELWQALERFADRRYVLLQAEGDRGPLRVINWGRGYSTFDESWVSSASGRSFADQPDRAYGRWVSDAYRATEREKEPRLDEIEASIWLPGRGRTTVSYMRLVLPIEVAGRGSCILSSAQAMHAL